MKPQNAIAIAIVGSLTNFAVAQYLTSVPPKQPCGQDDQQMGMCMLQNLSPQAIEGITNLQGADQAEVICANQLTLLGCIDEIDCEPIGGLTRQGLEMTCYVVADCKIGTCEAGPTSCAELQDFLSEDGCAYKCEDHPLVKSAYDDLRCGLLNGCVDCSGLNRRNLLFAQTGKKCCPK